MEILEAYDLSGSFRAAAKLAGCDHHTVARYVALREEGQGPEDGRASREKLIDPYLPKIEELVELVKSKNSSSPRTSPVSMHLCTISSKKPRKTSTP